MKNCANCKHMGLTIQRCYDCRVGRGRADSLLWEAESCPLPRIGSKEWGWRHRLDDGGKGWFECPKHKYQISWYAGQWCVVQMLEGGFSILFRTSGVVTCKRIAELLARRAWREASK